MQLLNSYEEWTIPEDNSPFGTPTIINSPLDGLYKNDGVVNKDGSDYFNFVGVDAEQTIHYTDNANWEIGNADSTVLMSPSEPQSYFYPQSGKYNVDYVDGKMRVFDVAFLFLF